MKLFVEMREFSPGVLQEELADENEGGSKDIDRQESDVGQDGCRIFAPKNQLVRGEEFQFTHEPENQGWQEGDGDERAFAIILGSFHLETSRAFPSTLPEAWEQGSQRRLSRSAPFVPVAAADGKDWGSKEGQSRRKSRNVAR